MVETANLGLPLLSGGQASKHVTMNEALTRIDTLLLLSVRSWTILAPPPGSVDGDRYVVPPGGQGDWAGRDGRLAVRVNGGWDFLAPLAGWRTFVEDEGGEIVFSQGVWQRLIAPSEPAETIDFLEFDHQVVAGGTQFTDGLVPEGCLLFGVSARVLEEVSGVTGWSLGVQGSDRRYGAELDGFAGAAVVGATGAPFAYPQATRLKITPEGGSFSGGRLRFRLYYLLFEAPSL
ncbi:MAG: DUF2793 domain-containing protein [Pseudomonadota bacterium]